MIGKNLPHNNLKKVRTEKHATQAQIADFLGVTIKTYRGYEKGQEYPKLEYLMALSDKWGVSIDYLLGRSDCTSVENDYISKKTGLSDKAINKLHDLVQRDDFLNDSNIKSAQRTDNLAVRPVHIPSILKTINFVLESRRATNLLTFLTYYLDSSKYTTLLDGSFKPLVSKDLYPADNDLVAGGVMIKIDSDTNKALAKNLLDIQLGKLAAEYKPTEK